jgi:tetratricopeptide (TPR) repeat protein
MSLRSHPCLRLAAALPSSHLLALASAVLSTACGAALSPPFTPPEAGGARWVEVTSAHFDLRSDLPMSEAHDTVEELEKMYSTLLDVGFPYAAKPAQQTRVIHFRREEEYKAVAPFGSSGFFTHAGWPGAASIVPIAVLYGDLTQKTRRVLQHELTHRFVGFYYPKAPAWLNEGFAHYYETLSTEDGYAVLGRPPFAFRRGLSWAGVVIPTSEVPTASAIFRFDRASLSMDREKGGTPEEESAERKRAVVNRAGAWALVHWLKNGPELYRTHFDAFLKKLGEGTSSAESWDDAFGLVDMDTFESDLAASLAPASKEVVLLRTPYVPPAGSIEREREMAPADVHLLWALIRRGRAASEVEAALQLDPGSSLAWRMRARLSASKGSFDAAENDLLKAVALSPQDPGGLFDLFSFYAKRSETAKAPPIWRQRAEALLPKVLPKASSPTVLNNVAWRLALWSRVDEALPLSLRSVEADPGCWACYDTLALVLFKKGALAKAVEVQSLAVNLMPEGFIDRDVFRRLREYKAAAASAPAQGDAPGPSRHELSDAVVRTIVARRRDGYQRCYADGVARDPTLAGRVIVRFVIERDGTVSSPADDGSTLPDKQVVQCVVGELAQLRFPAREAGEAQTVVYPFLFAASDAAAGGASPAP